MLVSLHLSLKAAFTVKLYLHYDTSLLLMGLLGFFPNKVIFEILRARSHAADFGDTST